MAKSVLNAPHFQNEKAAFAYVEARLWADGRSCPHCGVLDQSKPMNGKTTRIGLYKCYACRKPFTVRQGTIFEGSHLALHLWLQVIHLMCASKKGVSTRQVQRMLNCSMKTAWFLTHRIREAMAPGADAGPLGGKGVIVEADETYIGTADGKRGKKAWGGMGHKQKIMSLTERGGRIRSQRILEATKMTAKTVLSANMDPKSILHTDGSQIYRELDVAKEHEFVDHSISYVGYGKKFRPVHTNSLEGFFSVFKRGMIGTYQHCSEAHLNRYLAEFDFRQNNREKLGIDDVSRAATALLGTKGKRLTYETTKGA